MSNYVSRTEIAKKAGVGKTTIDRYFKRFGITKVTKDQAADVIKLVKSERRKTIGLGRSSTRSDTWNWRVSILGRSGWIVVRVGEEVEMRAWADMLCREGFNAVARNNRYEKDDV